MFLFYFWEAIQKYKSRGQGSTMYFFFKVKNYFFYILKRI